MKEKWLVPARMAQEIFNFLGVKYTVRNHQKNIIAEGEFGGKLLSLTYLPDNVTECGFQFRRCDTHRDLGGALLRHCHTYEFETERKPVIENGVDVGVMEDYKIVIVYSSGGDIAITKDGIHATVI